MQVKVDEMNVMLNNFHSMQSTDAPQVCSAIPTNVFDKLGHASNQLSTQVEQMQQACAKIIESTASLPPE
jgi:hypothetical protein